MARVNVDQVALTDARFARLAQLRGWADADHARGKMLLVWNETIHRGSELPVWLVDHHLGAGGAGDLLVAELATLVTLAGEVAGVPAGGTILRIKGCAGRSDYLEKKLNTAIAGGKARAASAQRTAGRFTSQAHQPAAGAVTSAPAPAPAPAPDTKERERVSGKPDVSTAPSLHVALAEVAVAEINRLSGSRYAPDSKSVLDLCKALAKDSRTPEQIRAVIAFKAAKWVGDPKMGDHFRPSTLLARSNFTKYLDDFKAQPTQRVTRMVSPEDDEPQLGHLLQLGAAP